MLYKKGKINIKISFIDIALISAIISIDTTNTFITAVISSIFHEIGHLTAFLYTKHSCREIRVCIFGIKITCNDILPYKDDILIAVCGPAVNLLLIIISFVLYKATLKELFLNAAVINAGLFVFNSLPAKPLDGERILRGLFTVKYNEKSGSVCEKAAFISILFIEVLFAVSAAFGNYNFTFIIVEIYLIINMIYAY